MFASSWGDSPEAALPPRYDLYDAQGNRYLLLIDEGMVAQAGGSVLLDGKQVTVTGGLQMSALANHGGPVLNVSSLTPVGEASALATVSGPKPWVVIMCRFADNGTAPKSRAYFQGLFGNTFPGIGDYWSRVSYGTVTLSGSYVMPSWMTLPHPRSHYISGSANLQALTNDCTGLADPTVNFAQFSGVAMMFNGDLDGFAWGGSVALNRDGVGGIRAAWMPPWGYENQNVLAHEVGHGFGLPHSSGPYNTAYDSPWDVMSAWPACGAHRDPTYGCVAVETISHHRNLLGWVASDRLYNATRGTNRNITLERLGQPTNPSGSYLMVVVPLPGPSTRYYTVEARRYIDGTDHNDFEEELIGNAIVIHLVDMTRGDRQAQVVDSDGNGNPRDGGSMWVVGETFRDAGADISIRVVQSTSTGFVVNIRNGGVANDNFSSPTTISAHPYATTLNASAATTQGTDPVFPCADTQGRGSVWYRFTPTIRGRVQLSTVGSNYDTLLGIWTGSAGSLTSRGCNDNGGGNGASVLSAILYANTTYYIEAAGKSGLGTLNLNLSFRPCYRLSKTVSPANTGAIATDLRPNCGGSFYTKGTTVQLAASPAVGRHFTTWSGSISTAANPASVVMDGARNITAMFIPEAPVVISPVGGAITSTLRPRLDWTDVPGATYQIQYSLYSNFSSPTALAASGSARAISSPLLSDTVYYWRVRAKADGLYSVWSGSHFRTGNPPSTPVPLSPENGYTAASLTPLLDWSDSSNAPAGYQLQVSSDSGFATLHINLAVTGSEFIPPEPLPASTKLYWRVYAFSSAGQRSVWSTIASFNTP
jgi:M6 family metalloprotease-like protein